MALGGAALGLLVALSVFVIIYSSITLSYVGYINQKGSAEAKKLVPGRRVALIWISAIMLALAVATLVVAIVVLAKMPRGGALRSGLGMM